MSTEFDDDLPSGDGGSPTKEQVLRVYNYLRSHKRGHSTNDVLNEMKALGFGTSHSTVGRSLVGAPGRAPPPKADKADKRVQRKRLNNRHEHKVAPKPEPVKENAASKEADKVQKLADAVAVLTESPELAVNMATLLATKENAPLNSSAMLAIDQSRALMAINIIIAHQMAAAPKMLMLDMRGTAALVDALTVSSKMTGGSAIDIVPQGAGEARANGVSPNGHPMKELNPPPHVGMAGDIIQWFQEQEAANRGSRA